MAGRFVRASKYRHVFGQPTKKEQCYDNLHISKNAWDTNLIKANPHYISVNWEASGGGAFAVIPVNERGRLPERIPLFRGHTAAVLDTDWNPFDDSLIVSSSDDGKVFLWRVPEEFSLHTDAEEPTDIAPVGRLSGHTRKVGHVLFNPAAENVLASASGDYTLKIWDIEQSQPRLTLKHTDIVQSLSWSADGALLVTTCRDKKLRIWDVRQEKPAQEVPGHGGAKNSRTVWMGELDRIATTGFSRMSDRQLGLWDVKNLKEPIGGFQILDSISGVCMPFWDDGTQCLYLAGKGDGNIRYFEYENDKFEYLSEYKSSDPQRGIAFVPKRGVNVHENEVMRAYKTVNDSYIEPISFVVPRRAEMFQSDIYPPTVGLKPGVSSGEWFEGQTSAPPKISLESVYEGKDPVEVPAASRKPASSPVTSPPPPKTEPEAPKSAEPSPAPVASRGPPPSVKDQKSSISAVASKFADSAEADEESDSSSFEEISKPTERPTVDVVARMEEKTRGPEILQEAKVENVRPALAAEPAKPDDSKAAAAATAPKSSQLWSGGSKVAASAESAAPAGAAGPTPAGAAEGIKSYLQDIKDAQSRTISLLEQQRRVIGQQMDQIMYLTAELDTLKTRIGERETVTDKDERIRRLELELEEAKSQVQ
ncbi:actin-binding protein-like protein [Trichodelitschia bisporula]|uniref:Coronin n=1 Tax=Trichodelitschia bisporula TaxID=703511 RepID=A0A6G1HXT9_9PEZI|nr:actin-binding protein-like protein [Trichodelitschia bisporula]